MTQLSALEAAQDAIRSTLAPSELTATELETTVLEKYRATRKTFERARARMLDQGELVRSGGGKHGPIRWSLASSLGHDPELPVCDRFIEPENVLRWWGSSPPCVRCGAILDDHTAFADGA